MSVSCQSIAKEEVTDCWSHVGLMRRTQCMVVDCPRRSEHGHGRDVPMSVCCSGGR